ncbi:hypothetical protein LWI28_015397 [Acer negundo]|uniref:Uncharacterized protein n=1 Tax=Acer negundo TaxID=4023 RepID=A0AAD5JFS5_ACENE|nr:hypothetical protein LWI28_015397 [Acer negundo]
MTQLMRYLEEDILPEDTTETKCISIVEAEDSIDVDGSGFKCCDPNEIGGYHSSDEKNGATKMVRYCVKHEWKPNLDGSVSLSEGLRAKFFATLRWSGML